jgi:hypothetical protein
MLGLAQQTLYLSQYSSQLQSCSGLHAVFLPSFAISPASASAKFAAVVVVAVGESEEDYE